MKLSFLRDKEKGFLNLMKCVPSTWSNFTKRTEPCRTCECGSIWWSNDEQHNDQSKLRRNIPFEFIYKTHNAMISFAYTLWILINEKKDTCLIALCRSCSSSQTTRYFTPNEYNSYRKSFIWVEKRIRIDLRCLSFSFLSCIRRERSRLYANYICWITKISVYLLNKNKC